MTLCFSCSLNDGHIDKCEGCNKHSLFTPIAEHKCNTCIHLSSDEGCTKSGTIRKGDIVHNCIYYSRRLNLWEKPKVTMRENDNFIDHPQHYNGGTPEVIEIIEGWDLGFHLGNVVKYVLRAPYKGTESDDIRKAIWYLNRYADLLEEREEEEQDRKDSTE